MIMHLMFAVIFKNLRKNLDIKFDPLTFCEFNTVVKYIIASKVLLLFIIIKGKIREIILIL